METPNDRSSRRWRWFWWCSAGAFAALVAPTVYNLVQLYSSRREADLPRAMVAQRSLTEGFFGPILAPWLTEMGTEIRDEVVEGNLISIKRLVPDSEESAYAEMELGRLAMEKGEAHQASLHLERYLKSGLGRDVDRARLLLSEAYRELKRFDDAAGLLRVVLSQSRSPEERLEASFRLGEVCQFHLNRPAEAMEIYRRALEDTGSPQSRWRNDIMTNLSLLKE